MSTIMMPRRQTLEPKYYATKRHLVELIDTREPGSLVPTERELSAQMGASRATIRQALRELVVEGRLVRRQGSGTYVADPKITWQLNTSSLSEYVRASGFSPSSEVLATRAPALRRCAAWPGLARQLAIAVRAPVYKIDRLRLVNDVPLAVETSWLSAERFPGVTRLVRIQHSLKQTLAYTYRTDLSAGAESIDTAPATLTEAGPLEIELGTPMLLVSRLSFDATRVPVLLVRTWFRGDRVTLVTELVEQGLSA